MPQDGSQSFGHSPPHSIFVRAYEVAAAPAPNFAFSTPQPPPHAFDMVEDINHHKFEEDELLELLHKRLKLISMSIPLSTTYA